MAQDTSEVVFLSGLSSSPSPEQGRGNVQGACRDLDRKGEVAFLLLQSLQSLSGAGSSHEPEAVPQVQSRQHKISTGELSVIIAVFTGLLCPRDSAFFLRDLLDSS